MFHPYVEESRDRYFSQGARVASWLEVEGALAQTQGEMGIIPKDSAQAIAAAAHIDELDWKAFQQESKALQAPVLALSHVLEKTLGAHGAYVHWGATTQNITDVGRQVILKRIQTELNNDLQKVLSLLSSWARDYADLPMAGRTNGQIALPITFGFKVASWIERLLRLQDRLASCEIRLFELRFGGAIGGFQSFGEQGPELARRLADKLGLGVARVQDRASLDPCWEYLDCLAAIGQVTGSIANDIYLLMTDGIEELSELQKGSVVGSSTMPHKRNPKTVVLWRAEANVLKMKSSFTLPPAMFEGDAASNREITLVLTEAAPQALGLLKRMLDCLETVRPEPERMFENLNTRGALAVSEAIMMVFARKIGRGRAHDLVRDMVNSAKGGNTSLKALAITEATKLGIVDVVRAQFDMSRHIGLCGQVARDLALEIGKRD